MDWDKADLEEQGQEDYQPFYGKDEEMKTNVKVRFDHSLTDNYEVEKTGEFTRPRDTRGHGSPSIFEPGAPDGGHLEELCGKVCLRNGMEGPRAFVVAQQASTDARLEKVCAVCARWYRNVEVEVARRAEA